MLPLCCTLQSVYHVCWMRGLFPEGSFTGHDLAQLDRECLLPLVSRHEPRTHTGSHLRATVAQAAVCLQQPSCCLAVLAWPTCMRTHCSCMLCFGSTAADDSFFAVLACGPPAGHHLGCSDLHVKMLEPHQEDDEATTLKNWVEQGNHHGSMSQFACSNKLCSHCSKVPPCKHMVGLGNVCRTSVVHQVDCLP